MGIIGGRIGYWMLRKLGTRGSPQEPAGSHVTGTALRRVYGENFFDMIQGKTVIDFGCGGGDEAVEMALRGAGRVIGLDIREMALSLGRDLAKQHSVTDRCIFTTSTDEKADIITSKDAFEHFDDPGSILRSMRELLKPEGFVLASFGPTWLHPHGGHLFSVFPWSHLIFTEKALIRWRSDFKSDGATVFSEVDGGLNQITIWEFQKVVEESPFRFDYFETVPIKGIGLLKLRGIREFGSSIVRCKLIPK